MWDTGLYCSWFVLLFFIFYFGFLPFFKLYPLLFSLLQRCSSLLIIQWLWICGQLGLLPTYFYREKPLFKQIACQGNSSSLYYVLVIILWFWIIIVVVIMRDIIILTKKFQFNSYPFLPSQNVHENHGSRIRFP